MADELRDAREALRSVLAEIEGLNVYKYPPSGGAWAYPAVVMATASRAPRIAMGGSQSFTGSINLILLISNQHDPEAFEQLDEFMEPDGPRSIEAVLESDTTWNSKVDWGNLVAVNRTGWRDFNGSPFVMADMTIDFLKQVL